MPIRLRLAALFALGAGIVLAMCGLLFVWQLDRGLDASMDNVLRSRVDAMASNLTQLPPTATTRSTSQSDTVDLSDNLFQVIDQSGRVVRRSAEVGSKPLIDGVTVARAQRQPVFTTVGSEERRTRVLAVPASFGHQPGVLLVATTTETADNAVDRVRNIFLLAAAPLVLLAAVAAWFLAGAALRPVEQLRRQVAELSEEDLSDGVEVPRTRDELAQLAQTMNELLSRVRRARVRERGFVADAGHELRTPLAIMRAELELAARPGRSNQELVEAIGVAEEETERLVRLAEGLLLLAQSDEKKLRLRLAPINIGELLESSARSARARVERLGVRIQADSPADLVAFGDADRLRQAVDNLLDNSVRYAPADSLIQITSSAVDGMLRISVTDEGPGFSQAFLPRAFQRFARGDESRSGATGGSGLGLAIVQSVAQTHGGTAVAGNTRSGGAVVTIMISFHEPAP